MKKVIFIMLVAALGVVTVNAQDHFKKGDVTLMGRTTGLDFGVTFPDGGGDNTTSLNFGIEGAYFVMDKLAITAGVQLLSETQGGNNSTDFGFTVGARYYVWDALFAGVAYEGWKMQDVDMQSFGNIQVGYTYYLSDKVFFEPALYFSKGFSDINKNSKLGLSIGIGINF